MKREITVLVVEDIDPLRELVCEVLSFAGYKTLEAGSGRGAIEIAEKYSGKVDLLISDCNLPGMGGSEVHRLLIQQCPSLQTIFMSGNAGDVPAKAPGSQSAHHFLLKPFTTSSLLAKVREVLPTS